MSPNIEIVDLGFSVADAEDIKFNFDGDHLVLTFIDWRAKPVSVRFENTIGYRYQRADYWLSDNERYDATHIVQDSKWLNDHLEQGEAWRSQTWYHYKLNFNAAGIIEVLCTGIKKT